MTRAAVNTMRLRRLRAVAVVLAVLVAAPGIEALLVAATTSQAASAAGEGIDAASLLGGGDAYAALERIEQAAEAEGSEVPDWYAEELGFLPGARDVRVSGEGSVVGYVVPGDSAAALDRFTARMRSLGWTPVSLGGVEGATFVKAGGSCTWALVTCTQVGPDTSVVARCAHT